MTTDQISCRWVAGQTDEQFYYQQ